MSVETLELEVDLTEPHLLVLLGLLDHLEVLEFRATMASREKLENQAMLESLNKGTMAANKAVSNVKLDLQDHPDPMDKLDHLGPLETMDNPVNLDKVEAKDHLDLLETLANLEMTALLVNLVRRDKMELARHQFPDQKALPDLPDLPETPDKLEINLQLEHLDLLDLSDPPVSQVNQVQMDSPEKVAVLEVQAEMRLTALAHQDLALLEVPQLLQADRLQAVDMEEEVLLQLQLHPNKLPFHRQAVEMVIVAVLWLHEKSLVNKLSN
jgi:hypothetical protein